MTPPELDKGYEIEWHPSCPRDEFGDLDIDRCQFEVERFATLDAAHNRAKVVLKEDVFGAVLIRDFFYREHDDDGTPYFDYDSGNFIEEVS